MSRVTTINLGDHFADFINELIAEGRYASASEIVRAGLRLLEEHETGVQALRIVMTEGETKGAAALFELNASLTENGKRIAVAK